MPRPLLLHVGDDRALQMTRTEILRSDYEVVECRSVDALDLFLHGDFDGVVLCGSIRPDVRRQLAKRIAERAPSTLIAEMGEPDAKDSSGALWLQPFSPELLNDAIAAALKKKHAASASGSVAQSKSSNG